MSMCHVQRPVGALPWLGLWGVVQAALLWQGSLHSPGTQLLTVVATTLLGALTLLWVTFDARLDKTPVVWFWMLAISVRCLLVFAMPLLEDDHYRYLWDGMRTATSFDPYSQAPAKFFHDMTLGESWQDLLSAINNPHIPTVYGPLLQLIFAASYLASPGEILGLKCIWLGIDLLVLKILLAHQTPMRWLWLYALHPLLLRESLASAHPDGLIGLLALLAMLFWHAHKPLLAGAMIGLATGCKWSALVMVLAVSLPPAGVNWVRWLPRLWFGCAACLAVLYLPFWWSSQTTEWQGLQTFAQTWRFNPLLFRLLDSYFSHSVARLLAILCFSMAWAWVCCWWLSSPKISAQKKWPPVDWTVALLLLISPVVNPWYWLWALAPAVLIQRPMAIVMGAVAGVSYINSTTLYGAGLNVSVLNAFQVPVWAAAVQIIAFSVVCFLSFKRHTSDQFLKRL